MSNKNKLISEDLQRFRAILSYSVDGKKRLNEAPEGENQDTADFGGEEQKSEEGNTDFDFGDEGSPEDQPEGGDAEENTDEFGTASNFSAADDIETDEEVEEIDVTDIVNKSDKARETAELAAQTSQETNVFIKDLADKLSNLESQLMKMDNIMSKVAKIEADIKTPEEKLELRSLDSYPFNMKLTDYWSEKMQQPNNNYKITNDEREYTLTDEDIKNYNDQDIKNSFNPGL